MARDVAPKLGSPKPALVHSKFFSSLQGPKGKMSASEESSAIYLDDSAGKIKKKIKGCFTGGGATLEEHRAKGADLSVDVPYQVR